MLSIIFGIVKFQILQARNYWIYLIVMTFKFQRRYGDVLDIELYKRARVCDVSISDSLDSDYLPIAFRILDPLKTRISLNQVETFSDSQTGCGFKAFRLC
jgi:hypothetical protein